ncbi:MAG TPA: hypothetical protein VGG39_04060 [Polyangiaceae bacterium]|jgi:hypothetical protein
MRRRTLLVVGSVVVLSLAAGSWAVARRPFPPETTPEGAYTRIAYAVAERHVADAFPYLETDAQWASFSIRDMRKAACERVRASYPAPEAKPLLGAWTDEATAPDGADVFARLAESRGWVARLERDLSGVAHVETNGERATVVTARGTRYPFRRRDNGIWGLTIFTAELSAEAERAARDLEVVQRAAGDYDRVRPGGG